MPESAVAAAVAVSVLETTLPWLTSVTAGRPTTPELRLPAVAAPTGHATATCVNDGLPAIANGALLEIAKLPFCEPGAQLFSNAGGGVFVPGAPGSEPALATIVPPGPATTAYPTALLVTMRLTAEAGPSVATSTPSNWAAWAASVHFAERTFVTPTPAVRNRFAIWLCKTRGTAMRTTIAPARTGTRTVQMKASESRVRSAMLAPPVFVACRSHDRRIGSDAAQLPHAMLAWTLAAKKTPAGG